MEENKIVTKPRSLEALCEKMEIKTDCPKSNKLRFYSMAQNRRRLDSENKKSNKTIYSAGILPFYVKNNTIYLLLGKDQEGKWSDFGGRAEGQDRGRWDSTASREFYEESVGAIMDGNVMFSRIQNNKNFSKLHGKTLNGSPYFMYFVKIPYRDSYRDNFHSTLNFIRYTRSFDKKYIEKTDIQWISLDTIYTSLDESNAGTINYPLRKVFKKTFEENLEEIKLFGSKFFEHYKKT